MSRKKPTKLSLADGTHRTDRHGPRTIPAGGLTSLPDPPEGLDAEGRRRWSMVGQALIDQQLLTQVDLFSLEHLCKLYDQQASLELLLKEQESAATRRLLAKTGEEIRRMLDALGCAPTARPGVAPAQPQTPTIGPRNRQA